MKNYAQTFHFLTRKKNLFLQIEEITDNMCLLQVEELLVSVEARQIRLEEITQLDITLKEYCQEDPLLKSVLNHDCTTKGLSDELCTLYDIALSIKACVNRIMQNDENVRLHLAFEKDRILSNIEQLNTSSTVVADRYHRSIQTANSNPFGVSQKKWI